MCQIGSLFDWDTTLKATAYTYAGRMKTGRTHPMKFHCRTQDLVASTLDVVAKLSGTWEIGKPGFATEVFVSHLARIAGIYCPQPVILFIPEDVEIMVKYLQDVLRQTDQLKSAFTARICQ